MWVVLLEILFCKTNYSDNTLLSPRYKTSTVTEKFNWVNRSIVSTYFAHLVSMHYVTDVSLETWVTSCHGSHYSSYTTSHSHMEFRLVLITEKWRNWDCIHGQFLFEVSNHLQGLRIQYFWAIISGSGKNWIIFAESQRVDFSCFMNKCFFENSTFHIVMQNPAICSTDEESLVIDIPECSWGNFEWFSVELS